VVQKVIQTLRDGGKVIVPSFAVGRTQQLVYLLNQRIREASFPNVPVFVDSPLAVNATEVHRLHPECFNPEIYEFLREEGNPFEMPNLTYIRNVDHSKNLNTLEGPAIIISASGMAEAGRILHHLRNHIGDPKNMILFVGYCADHTLGARLREGRNPINIFGEPHAVKAQVAAVDFLSGHADRKELVSYVKQMSGPMRRIFVVHGQEDQSLAFAQTLREWKPDSEVVVPEQGQVETV